MSQAANSRFTQAAAGVFAGVLLGMLIEVCFFWPDGDWPPPRQFILRLSGGVRLPVAGPAIGAIFLAILGATTGGITIRGMVSAVAIGSSTGAFIGIFAGGVLGAVLSDLRDRRLAAAGFHVPKDAAIDKGSQINGLMIGVIGGTVIGIAVGIIVELRSRHRCRTTASEQNEESATSQSDD